MAIHAVADEASWSSVDERQRGANIARRRALHGINSVRELAKRTGLSRDAITAAEGGAASINTYLRLEAWLDEFDQQTGLSTRESTDPSASVPAPRREVEDADDLPRDIIEIDVIGPSTRWQVKLRGHSGDADLLRNQAEKLLRNVGSDED